MKAANKDLVLIVAAALAAYYVLSRKGTITAGTVPAGSSGAALSPSANAANLRLGKAILGVPDILGILKGSNLPTVGAPYPSANDWLAVQTGTDQIADNRLLTLDNSWMISKSNPFGPAIDTNPTDPMNIGDSLGFITGSY